MRIGSLVFATDQGLGVLAKSFYDAGIVTDVLVVRHGTHPTHMEWYPGQSQLLSVKDVKTAFEFADKVDMLLFFETPFVWELIPYMRRRHKKTVMMPMYECSHKRPPYIPDAYLNPSLLDQKYFPDGRFIPVPVSYPWKQRTQALTFVHNAGNGGLLGRNGTAELIEAMKLVESPVRLQLRAQPSSRKYWKDVKLPPNVDLTLATVPYEDLFSTGDVFVFPEKFNGLSLPLQEARAAGMLVMCGNRFPMNTWLPSEPLIRVDREEKTSIGPPYMQIQKSVILPRDIAAKIDEVYGSDITEYSESGKSWADTMSWERLKPLYMEYLCG